jgi:imidazolonepropionase-like amidohydrolase
MPFIGNLATSRMGLDPFAALVAATRNPSTTLDDPDVTGTIAEGSRADINILWSQTVDGWCQTPGENPVIATIIEGSIVNMKE